MSMRKEYQAILDKAAKYVVNIIDNCVIDKIEMRAIMDAQILYRKISDMVASGVNVYKIEHEFNSSILHNIEPGVFK